MEDRDTGDRDRVLVARVQGGDATAFDELVHRHIEPAYASAYRILRDPADAEDVVQEVFLRVVDKIGMFDNSRPFAPWFHRLVVNTAINAFRRRSVRKTEPEALDAPAPRSDDPHVNAERSEIRRRFALALEGLSDRQRVTVVLHEVEGYSTEEIAELLGVTQETVRGHLHLARKALREALAAFREEK